ncbi:MAG: pyridoxamine 5'-phosphate oxidase family protein [Bacteroidota bacterium]
MNHPLNLEQEAAIKKLKEMADEIDMCLFCTSLKTGDGATCRPMSTQMVDDNGDIWFMSGKDSDKNRDIQHDNQVQLFYAHPGKSSYMVVNGTASISEDRQKIEALWTPLAKAWFKEGKSDPNISLIRVSDINAYYWDTKGNRMVNFVKMVASAATGKTLLDAEEGAIKVSR